MPIYGGASSSGGIAATLLDAKGDLIAATANDTAARLAVGSDGQILTADAASTPGVKWAAAGASDGLGATIMDAKGDLIAASAADTPVRLAVGTNGLKLKAASAATEGVKWDCGFGTTLPASPVTGDEYFWEVDATNGVVWHMFYDGTLTKWLFLGGPPLFSEVLTSESTASTTYAALTTAGPLIALPGVGGGLYNIGIGCEATQAGSGIRDSMSYDIGGTGAVDADRITMTVSNTNTALNLSRWTRKTIATQLTLTAKYKTGSGTASFANRWMSLLPVQVNPS